MLLFHYAPLITTCITGRKKARQYLSTTIKFAMHFPFLLLRHCNALHFIVVILCPSLHNEKGSDIQGEKSVVRALFVGS